MIRRLRWMEWNHAKWPSIAVAMTTLGFMACGGVALRAYSPTVPAPPQTTRGDGARAPHGVLSRDSNVVSAETMALAAFDGKLPGKQIRQTMLTAAQMLRPWQWDEERGITPSHPYYGGTGQWPKSAPDLVHTALALEALRRAGVAEEDSYCRRALTFVMRCQIGGRPDSLRGAILADRGGFASAPALTEGTGEIGLAAPNGLATCLGVTSLLSAGVPSTDMRVQNAVHWLEAHYSLDAHPGIAGGREGLYHYYYQFAKAMTALGCNRLRDRTGRMREWRVELNRKLSDQQNADGSWTNAEESAEPGERAPATITSLALLTLLQVGK